MASFKVHVLEKNPEIITSGYGQRKDPVTGAPKDFHHGVDLVGPNYSLSYIISFAAGTVTTVSYSSARGNYVIVKHNDTYSTRYQHMESGTVAVKVGQEVSKGQRLGYMGATGKVTGKHLHFEMLENGSPVDPISYLEGTKTISTGGADEKVVVIARGDEGVQVNILQGILISLGYYTMSIDGHFGPGTEEAVKKYQSDHGLSVDGRCGPATSKSIAETVSKDK